MPPIVALVDAVSIIKPVRKSRLLSRFTGTTKKVESTYDDEILNVGIDGCYQNNHINMGETKIKVNL